MLSPVDATATRRTGDGGRPTQAAVIARKSNHPIDLFESLGWLARCHDHGVRDQERRADWEEPREIFAVCDLIEIDVPSNRAVGRIEAPHARTRRAAVRRRMSFECDKRTTIDSDRREVADVRRVAFHAAEAERSTPDLIARVDVDRADVGALVDIRDIAKHVGHGRHVRRVGTRIVEESRACPHHRRIEKAAEERAVELNRPNLLPIRAGQLARRTLFERTTDEACCKRRREIRRGMKRGVRRRTRRCRLRRRQRRGSTKVVRSIFVGGQ